MESAARSLVEACMIPLREVVETLVPEADGFAIDAPPDWSQGRTLYGGMTAALAYEAVKRALGDLGPLRSAQLSFVGPAAGRLRFKPTLLRRGRSSAIVSIDCVSDEGAAARAIYVFGAARESQVAHDFLAMPAVAAADACPSFRKEGAKASRGFWNNFETRLAAGSRLLEPTAPRAEFSVWTRMLDPAGADPLTAFLALADCLPPAAMVHFPIQAPISTMTWTVDLTRQPERADGWYLLHSASDHAADGYSMQSMVLWDNAGAALAVGRQCVAIFA